MSYTATSGSPFAWSRPTGTGALAQVTIFSAPWIQPSTRAFIGTALADGYIVPTQAMVGSTRLTPTITDNRSYFGGAWGLNGAAKVVSDDRFMTITNNLTWSFSASTGNTSISPTQSRILATRLPS